MCYVPTGSGTRNTCYQTGISGPWAFEAMGTLVVNDQEIMGTGLRFKQVTEPNEGQRRILEALELKVESFQRGWSGLDPGRIPPHG